MITVHHLERSRSARILWLLEELGVPYEVKRYARDPVTMLAPPELRKVHPLGKSPVVTDGDLTLAESGAIVEYLVDRYGEGRLAPARGTPEHLRYTFFLHYAEGSLMPPLLLALVFSEVRRKAPRIVRPIAKAIAAGVRAKFIGPALETHFGYVESCLETSTWLLGDEVSAADIQMSFPIEAYLSRGDAEKPRLRAFALRMRARPAYQRALARGGPFEIPG